jgi:hypothetical protein
MARQRIIAASIGGLSMVTRKNIGAALLVFFSSGVWADEVKTLAELALLPPYCKGTQAIRTLSKDPVPIERYMEIYGAAYYHMHHYCWALNTENNALRINDAFLRKSKLGYALDDYKYFIDRAPPSFPLLPEVYISRARVLFTLKRDDAAIADLNTAIRLKPEYSLPYARLSEYYQGIGDKSNAIQALERGIAHTRNPQNIAYFKAKLEKLGQPFQGVPGSALAEIAAVPTSVPESAPSSSVDPLPASAPGLGQNTPAVQPGQSTPEQAADRPNPYCRFCP